MSALGDYADKYQSARLERRDGILQVTLHTEGQSLRWGFLPHGELPELFHDIGADRDNRVVILTGTGAEFSGPRATPGTSSRNRNRTPCFLQGWWRTIAVWERSSSSRATAPGSSTPSACGSGAS